MANQVAHERPGEPLPARRRSPARSARGMVWIPPWVAQRDSEPLCLTVEHPVRQAPATTVGVGMIDHLGLRVSEYAKSKRFFETALAAGGSDNGAPGLRPEYHPSYYGAFVLDPDGNNVEAVCHQTE